MTYLIKSAFPAGHHPRKILSALLLALLLTACSAAEPEEREYALGMLIGKDGISIAAAELSGESEGRPGCVFYDGSGETLAQAVSSVSNDTGGRLYMGQLMLCVIEKDALDRKTLSELTDLFCTDDDLSRGAVIAAADDIQALKKAEHGKEDIISYMRKYSKSSALTGKGAVLDCDSLIHTLISTDGSALIPFMECSDNKLRINGAVAVADWQYAKNVDAETAEAALWLIHGRKDSLVINSGGNVIQFDKVSISKKINNGIEYNIKTRARLLQSSSETDTAKAERELAEKILAAADILHNCGCDYSEASAFYRLKTGTEQPAAEIPQSIVLKTAWKGI